MIKRIRISGYKSFKHLDLKLGPLSVIFGPNASGKSNLLDAIYLISKMATEKTLTEAFSEHRGLPLESFYYGDEGYEQLLNKETVKMHFEVDVALSNEVVQKTNRIIREKMRGIDIDTPKSGFVRERLLRYSLVIEALTRTGHLRVVNERLAALRRDGEEKKSRAPFLERVEHEGSPRLHLRTEGQGHPFYYDVGLDHTVVSTPLYERHYPHITALREEMSRWQLFHLEPRSFMRKEEPVVEVNKIGPRGNNLAAFLNTMQQQDNRAFEDFNLAFNMVMPVEAGLKVERLKDGRLMLHVVENGLPCPARLVSEGTLRLVGLLAAVAPSSPDTVVCLEEPDTGVDPARLKIIADILKQASRDGAKQIITTTHSPLLLDHFDDKELFVSRKQDRQTTIAPFNAVGPVFRRRSIQRALQDVIAGGDCGG